MYIRHLSRRQQRRHFPELPDGVGEPMVEQWVGRVYVYVYVCVCVCVCVYVRDFTGLTVYLCICVSDCAGSGGGHLASWT